MVIVVALHVTRHHPVAYAWPTSASKVQRCSGGLSRRRKLDILRRLYELGSTTVHTETSNHDYFDNDAI
jgi:hypothetical protein